MVCCCEHQNAAYHTHVLLHRGCIDMYSWLCAGTGLSWGFQLLNNLHVIPLITFSILTLIDLLGRLPVPSDGSRL